MISPDEIAEVAPISFGHFRLKPEGRLLEVDGRTVSVGKKSFDILYALASRPGEVVTKAELTRLIWPDTIVEEVNLRVQVASLRRLLDQHGGGAQWIKNVAGRGYCFAFPAVHPKTIALEDEVNFGPVFSKPSTHLVGRGEEIIRLCNLITERRLVTVAGPGGVGKTAAALAAATFLREDAGIDTYFVDLSSVSNPHLVTSAIASSIGIPVFAHRIATVLTEALSGRRVLIILDNCEHVVDSAAVAAEAMRAAGTDVFILATSREPLRARDEWVFRLRPLDTPVAGTTYSVSDALSFASVQLFVERAKSSFDGFQVDEQSVGQICEICRTLDGLPLAIELAAARVQFFGVQGLLHELVDRFSVLTQGRRTALPRQQTLGAAFDWSYKTLSDYEKLTLRRISIFRGEFDLDAASSVLQDEIQEASTLFGALCGLVDKSLLTINRGPCSNSYRLLDSTREYGKNVLGASGEKTQVAAAHLRYLNGVCAALRAVLPDRVYVDERVKFLGVIDNVRSALDWAFGENGDSDLGIELTCSSEILWYQFGLLDEYRSRVETALQQLSSYSDPLNENLFRLKLALGHAAFHTLGPQSSKAVSSFADALSIATECANPTFKAQALYGLVGMSLMSGQYASGLNLVSQFALLAQTSSVNEQILNWVRALVAAQSGDLRASESFAHAALSTDIEAVTPSSTREFIRYEHRPAAKALLARVLWQVGDADDALTVALESLEEARGLMHGLTVCYSLLSGACPVACWRGDGQRVADFLSLLRGLTEELALAAWKIPARCFDFAHLSEDAIPHVDPSNIQQFTGFAPPFHELLATLNLSMVTPLALDRAHSGKAGWSTSEILRAQGETLLLRVGQVGEGTAKSLFHKSIQVAKKQGALAWELRAVTSLARLEIRKGEMAHAQDVLNNILSKFSQGFNTRDLRMARSLLNDTLA